MSFGSRKDRRKAGTRGVLGAVAVAWLTLALQPCAMALQVEQVPDCPNCPPAHTQHIDAHDMASHDMPCASSVSDCDMLGDLSNNERADQVKLKNLPACSVLAAAPVQVDLALEYVATMLATYRPHGGSPPLRKLYCVYLK